MKSPLTALEDRFEDNLPNWYWKYTVDFQIWRYKIFPWYYRWKNLRRHKRNMIDKFGFVPTVGDRVNDCRGIDGIITSVDKEDPDTVVIDGVHNCSLWHCCDRNE